MLSLFKSAKAKPVLQLSAPIFLARQPIFDAARNVFAYELLYRSGNTNSANFDDADKATSELITNTFLSIGLDAISDGKPVFINLPRKFITGELPLPLDPKNVVLEILEGISADEQAVNGVSELVRQGFTLALDDFVPSDDNRAFIPHAGFIKVDVLNLSEAELRKQTNELKHLAIPLLAEKVETEEQFLFCVELGYRYFQGFFFSKPTIVEGKELSSNQLSLLNVLAKLQDVNCEIEELQQIIANDAGLSFKLLKIINSSFYGVGRTVDSIQHALILLGLNALKKWVMLVTLSSSKTKTTELLYTTLLRAKHCENLAQLMSMKTETAFTVGMFSLLDAIMDQPLPALLAQLPLSQEINLALLEGKGDQGALLNAVSSFQAGRWEGIEPRFAQDSAIQTSYEQALLWCGIVKHDLGV